MMKLSNTASYIRAYVAIYVAMCTATLYVAIYVAMQQTPNCEMWNDVMCLS